jgi:glutathione-independent formaldehyde dehydrogenase
VPGRVAMRIQIAADMIITGAANSSQVVSHRLSLDEAPAAFAKFDARQAGYIKVIRKPS